jgi:hypothetical protein
MAVAAIKTGNDHKKLVLAIALGVVAILTVWWAFFGFGSSAKPVSRSTASVALASPSPSPGRGRQGDKPDDASSIDELHVIPANFPLPSVPEAKRNIFAYYVPPPSPSPVPSPIPSPSPPSLLLASISPSTVYARTDDFSLDVTGDKFTSAVRVLIDGRPLPTRYTSPQQISATVPAALIANPGQRRVEVKSDDGKLNSNVATLIINAPPTPNYSYIGIIGKPRHIGDTALLQDKSSKEIVSVQRGDVLSGRFRVSSISERELVVVDTNLKIKHTLAITNDGDRSSYPPGRPTPRVQSEDDEP